MDDRARRIKEHILQNLPRRGGDSDRPRILEANREIRKDGLGGLPGAGWGHVALNIPIPDMRVLQLRFPELASIDPETQHRAWQKFIRSPESELYKVRRNDGKRRAVDRVLVR